METIAFEMKASIVDIGGERSWNETRESWIGRAARKAGISYCTAKKLFYMEMPDPKASIVQKVRAARGELSKQQNKLTNYELLLRKDNGERTRIMFEELKAAHSAIGALLARYNSSLG